MRYNDPRTDNWAGRRDPGSDPNNFRFPRSAREAGFYYGPYKKESVWPVYVALVVFIGLLYWVG